MDRRAHRHPRSATSPRPTQTSSDLALARGAQRARGRRHATPSDDRPDHRRHHDAGHGVPVDRLHPAGEARHQAAAPRSTCRRCAAASSTRSRSPTRMITTGARKQRAGGRRGSVLAHPRLERPQHLRAVRRRRRRGRARGRSTSRASSPAQLHADGSHADILCVPGNVRGGAIAGDAVPADGRPGGVQARGRACSTKSRARRSPRPA